MKIKLLLLWLLLIGLATADARTWYSRSGKSVDAEFHSISNDFVFLSQENQPLLRIPLSALSDQDQKYVSELVRLQTPDIPPAKSNLRGRRWMGSTKTAGKIIKILEELGATAKISKKHIEGPICGAGSRVLYFSINVNEYGYYEYEIEENLNWQTKNAAAARQDMADRLSYDKKVTADWKAETEDRLQRLMVAHPDNSELRDLILYYEANTSPEVIDSSVKSILDHKLRQYGP